MWVLVHFVVALTDSLLSQRPTAAAGTAASVAITSTTLQLTTSCDVSVWISRQPQIGSLEAKAEC
jgi:hypothetical protein